VRHIDLPCTPERVWRTIRAAESGVLAHPWSEPPDIFDRLRADANSPADEDPADEDPAGAAAADGI
jgi:carbon-monoxide dehydrogenase large subunit